MQKKIIILGAAGQIGTELTLALRARYGTGAVLATDIAEKASPAMGQGPYQRLDVLHNKALQELVLAEKPDEVYLLAALLSATAEKKPALGWELNMNGLSNVLDLAREGAFQKLFWPSSIAVFGPRTPKNATPQHTVMEPTTVYGITKVAGESWCEYYHRRYGVDVRSVRYPGIVGYKSPPGGGTTDYAVHIFYEALQSGRYTSFVGADAELPMMYMPDAVKATLAIMDAPAAQVKLRSSYNIAGFSFTPQVLAEAIREQLAHFKIDYEPDHRDAIARSWPSSIDDSDAQRDWGWKPDYTLRDMVKDMLQNIEARVKQEG